MAKAKNYQIQLSKKQIFFSLLALILCFLLTFALGAITGIKFLSNTSAPLLTSSSQHEAMPAPSASNYGSLESLTVSEPEGDKVVHEFTFYDTLPENADAPVPKAPAKMAESGKNKKARTNKTIPSNKEGPPEKYTVQIGSFQHKEKAYALSNKLKKQGYLTHVTTTKIENKGTFYRVRMGTFDTQEEAKRWVSQLPPLSPPPFITSATD
jgi:cell division septation protein DedD